MLNIRTIILSVIVVVVLLLTIPLVAAKTEVALDAAIDAAQAPESQVQSVDLEHSFSPPRYRSQFGDCFDVPIRELAACRQAGATGVSSNLPALDECFDVSLWEVASCRNASDGY